MIPLLRKVLPAPHSLVPLQQIPLRNSTWPRWRSAIGFTIASCLMCAFWLGSPATLHGQTSDSAESVSAESVSAGHSYHGEAFNEGPRQSAVLIDGLPTLEFPTSTKSESARAFFLQGLAQLHGFWFLEAERSFRQAVKEDPKLAIAYWGMAMANANNDARARGLIDEAKKLRKNAGKHEQLYIDALERFLPSQKMIDDAKAESEANKSTAERLSKKQQEANKKKQEEQREAKKSRAARYANDMERILDSHPDDIEAKAFIALHLWQSERNGLKISSHYAVDALLGEVFAKNPMHPAHHYRIHLWDGRRPENALHSAAQCGPSAPAIAHMWHMPGHIYSKLKRYEDAAWQQEASARVDHEHMNRARLMPDQIHNFAHNNEWLVRNLQFLGRVDEALEISRDLISLPMHPKYNSLDKKGSQRYGRERLQQTLFQYGLWQAMIDETGGPFLTPSDDAAQQDQWLCHLAVARFMTGDNEHAGRTLRSLQRRRLAVQTQLLDLADAPPISNDLDAEAAGDDADEDAEPAPTRDALQSRLKSLQKSIACVAAAAAAVRKDKGKLAEHLKSAGVDLTTQAEWTAMAGDAGGAIRLAQQAVKEGTNQVRPLAVLVHLLWLNGDRDEAKKQFEKLRSVASVADIGTPMLARLGEVAEDADIKGDWRKKASPAEDLGSRPPLGDLGPISWQPYQSPRWQALSSDDQKVTDEQYRGRPRIVIFYLGFGCLHCIEQLHAFAPEFEKFADLGIEIIAISTEGAAELATGITNFDKPLPIPLMADPSAEVFKSFRCWDDFEDQPLHGTFLIDAQNRVRWQDISYEPFTDVDFLLNESKRLLNLDPQR
ncbi:redoxin domain-containing protein [Stieleria varia]|nr:redoxin domain-containing protein [Stieleria varia]